MINSQQLRDIIIAPVLDRLGHMSRDAEELLFAIACHESRKGTYVKQVSGEALGIYQMEKETYFDQFDNFLCFKPELKNKILRILGVHEEPRADRLATDLELATIMCRIFFLRIPEPLPPADDINKIAIYWKKYYNTSLGKGNIEDFVSNYKLLK